jgi:hypothetical protein
MELLPSNAPTAPLFVELSGEKTPDPLSTRTIQRIMARYGKVTGIKVLTPHVLRHTCAKSLIDEGVSIDRVADTLLRGAQKPGDNPALHAGQPGRSAGRGGKDRHQVNAVLFTQEAKGARYERT